MSEMFDKKVKEYPYVFPDEITEALETIEVKICVQALKYIISNHPNPDVYNVLKMLYFADRAHLLKCRQLITPDRYVKLRYGPVPSMCLSIIQFVRGDEFSYVFNESIKEEFKVLEKNKLELINPPTPNYLFESETECLGMAIEKYGRCDFNELKGLSHDEIYDSVTKFNDEITVFHMANVLDRSGELTRHLKESYPYKIMF
jgi:hypothetical protein